MLWGGIKKSGKCFVTCQDCSKVEKDVWMLPTKEISVIQVIFNGFFKNLVLSEFFVSFFSLKNNCAQ